MREEYDFHGARNNPYTKNGQDVPGNKKKLMKSLVEELKKAEIRAEVEGWIAADELEMCLREGREDLTLIMEEKKLKSMEG